MILFGTDISLIHSMFSPGKDESVINMRGESDDNSVEFKIDHVEQNVESKASCELEAVASSSSDKVKIKFDKFVNLVATHAYEEIVEKHMDDDIIISTDLLADLANAHEERGEKKMPMMLLLGVLIGIAITWFLIKY